VVVVSWSAGSICSNNTNVFYWSIKNLTVLVANLGKCMVINSRSSLHIFDPVLMRKATVQTEMN
jgi:hypothetical protein